MSKIITNNITPRSGGSVGLTGGLNVTGSVSVGGTITYEDVTNIDSVGIVTARTGVRVNAGGLVVTAGVSTLAADLSITDKIIHTGDTNTAIRFPVADTFTVETAGSERLRIKSTGVVQIGDAGLGSDNGDRKLEVIGSGNGQAGLLIANNATSASGTCDISFAPSNKVAGAQIICEAKEDFASNANRTADLTFQTRKDGTLSEKLRITSAGKIGIGIPIPAAALDIKHNSASEHLRLTEQTSGKYSAFGVDTSDNLRIYVNNSERMRIDSSGLCSINTTDADGYLLNLERNTQVLKVDCTGTGDVVGAYFRHARGGLSGFTGKMISFRGNDNTEEGSIVINTSSTSYNTSSDYRLKENQQSIVDGIERVKRLSPYRFNFIKDPDTTVDGFFAHEAQAVIPEAVTGEKDGEEMQGIDHSKLVPLLTAALQEAITKIETLEQRLSDAGIA